MSIITIWSYIQRQEGILSLCYTSHTRWVVNPRYWYRILLTVHCIS